MVANITASLIQARVRQSRNPAFSFVEVAEIHIRHIKLLSAFELLEEAIPHYLQSQPMGEQQYLVQKSDRWLHQYWDKKGQRLRYQYYLASVGELNDRPVHEFIVNYACYDDFI